MQFGGLMTRGICHVLESYVNLLSEDSIQETNSMSIRIARFSYWNE
jgi:hypothetical protein